MSTYEQCRKYEYFHDEKIEPKWDKLLRLPENLGKQKLWNELKDQAFFFTQTAVCTNLAESGVFYEDIFVAGKFKHVVYDAVQKKYNNLLTYLLRAP